MDSLCRSSCFFQAWYMSTTNVSPSSMPCSHPRSLAPPNPCPLVSCGLRLEAMGLNVSGSANRTMSASIGVAINYQARMSELGAVAPDCGQGEATYALQHGVHEARIAMVDEPWWKQRVLLLLFPLLSSTVDLLRRRRFGLSHQGLHIGTPTRVADC